MRQTISFALVMFGLIVLSANTFAASNGSARVYKIKGLSAKGEIYEKDFNSVLKQLIKLDKSEFETFSEYQARLQKLVPKEITIDLPVNAKAHKCNESPRFSIRSAISKYDAENKLMHVGLERTPLVNELQITCYVIGGGFHYSSLRPVNATTYDFQPIRMEPGVAKNLANNMVVRVNFSILIPQSDKDYYSWARDLSDFRLEYSHLKDYVAYVILNKLELVNNNTKQTMQKVEYPNQPADNCAILTKGSECFVPDRYGNCIGGTRRQYQIITNECSQDIVVYTNMCERLSLDRCFLSLAPGESEKGEKQLDLLTMPEVFVKAFRVRDNLNGNVNN